MESIAFGRAWTNIPPLPYPSAALRSGDVVEGDYAPLAKIGRYAATFAAMDGRKRRRRSGDR